MEKCVLKIAAEAGCLDLLGCSEAVYEGKRFKIDKRYVKVGLDGTILQSDSLSSPLEEWNVCEPDE